MSATFKRPATRRNPQSNFGYSELIWHSKMKRKASFPFAFYSFFRNFAIKRWRNYSVSAKKRIILLFCSRLFVTLASPKLLHSA